MSTTAALLGDDQLDRAFGALADRTRRAILARLATEGDAGVLDVASPFAMSQPAVTKHLKVLEEAGLISRHRLSRRRMCHLEPQRLKQLSEWVGSYRQYWEESFERLDELLEDMQKAAAAPTADQQATSNDDSDTSRGEGM